MLLVQIMLVLSVIDLQAPPPPKLPESFPYFEIKIQE